MVTAEAPLTNGTTEPLTNGTAEPKINHTVFPVPEIDYPTTASASAPAVKTAEPEPLPTMNHTVSSTPSISIDSSDAVPATKAMDKEPLPTANHETISTPSISIDAPAATTTESDALPAINHIISPISPIPSISIDSPTKTSHTVPSITTSAPSEPIEEEPLFSSDLVSPAIAAQLPPTYTIRALKKSDYAIGFLDCLRVLTVVGDVTEQEFNERYDFLSTQGKGGYYLLVIEDGGRIVGTGALIVERKFIHHLGLVGHIEDIAVAKDQQGKKLGLKLIQALDFIAEKVGCYKTILDCSEANEGFYVKCGFKRAGLEMAHYYEKPKST